MQFALLQLLLFWHVHLIPQFTTRTSTWESGKTDVSKSRPCGLSRLLGFERERGMVLGCNWKYLMKARKFEEGKFDLTLRPVGQLQHVLQLRLGRVVACYVEKLWFVIKTAQKIQIYKQKKFQSFWRKLSKKSFLKLLWKFFLHLNLNGDVLDDRVGLWNMNWHLNVSE